MSDMKEKREKDTKVLVEWLETLPDEKWVDFYEGLSYIAQHPAVLILAMKLHDVFEAQESKSSGKPPPTTH